VLPWCAAQRDDARAQSRRELARLPERQHQVAHQVRPLLGDQLRTLGLQWTRLKTGTPPRVDARTIDFSLTEVQPGSPTPLYFSFSGAPARP